MGWLTALVADGFFLAPLSMPPQAARKLAADRPAPSGRVYAGVRPEKISLVADGGAPPAGNVVRGQLRVASFLGTAIQYVVTTAAGDELTVVEQNRGGEAPPAPGSQVALAWRPEHTFVVASTEQEPHEA